MKGGGIDDCMQSVIPPPSTTFPLDPYGVSVRPYTRLWYSGTYIASRTASAILAGRSRRARP